MFKRKRFLQFVLIRYNEIFMHLLAQSYIYLIDRYSLGIFLREATSFGKKDEEMLIVSCKTEQELLDWIQEISLVAK